jgi:CHAT domain-containing protein
MVEGELAYERGHFEEALTAWWEASRSFEQQGRWHEQSAALHRLANAYQSLGLYDKALESLASALAIAREDADHKQVAAILGTLGDLHIARGTSEDARACLEEALTLTEEAGDRSRKASLLNGLGNLHTLTGHHAQALDCYLQSAAMAAMDDDHALAATALVNAAMVSLESGEFSAARTFLEEALPHIEAMPPTHGKAYSLVSVGLACQRLAPQLSPGGGELHGAGKDLFRKATAVAESIADARAASYAWGYWGRSHEEEGRLQEALQMTAKAVLAAQQANAPESLWRWQWQAARLLRAGARPDEAIAAYRQAAATLQSIREAMRHCYGRSPLAFRDTASPLYLEFVDLLLLQAASLEGWEEQQGCLREARQTIELLKVYELRDYFRDECVDGARASRVELDQVSRTAVIVYPILLKDRTELLVSFPAGIKLFSTKVGAEVVMEEVRTFRRQLEKLTTREYLPQAQKLYDLFIRPFDQDLQSSGVDTVVFVPDGPLRTIPLAALHDGSRFLIQRYALAVTPGLDLTAPGPLQKDSPRVLALGLTEAAQGYPPLPHVAAELETIQGLYPGRVLLNQDFRLSTMGEVLRAEPFTMVHIASHGEFAGDVDQTFLLAFDGRLTIDRLDETIGLLRFRKDPLDLLTLSACETAAGDDRAALGLAGIAVRAGARSALATLWHVNDEASSSLVAEFYRRLRDPSVSRSAALQQAQVKLIQERRYQHPGYWAPFLLINNWL